MHPNVELITSPFMVIDPLIGSDSRGHKLEALQLVFPVTPEYQSFTLEVKWSSLPLGLLKVLIDQAQ